MTRSPMACLQSIVLAGAITACSPPPAMMPDAGDATAPMDATPTDAQTDAQDVPTADGGVCNMVPIENLNALGTVMGDTLRYVGDNTMARDSTSAGIQVPAAAQQICAYRSTRQRVFAYTTRTASVLRISTSNPGTRIGFDTTLTVLGNPCPRTGARLLGCNDDDPAFGGDERRVTSTVLTTPVAAGTTVYIGLGGFVGIDGTRNPEGETGTFELTIQELPTVPDGMPCDTRRINNSCGENSTCVPNQFPSEMGTCRANGTAAGTPCVRGMCTGTGLTCDTDSGFCVQTNVPDGMRCDPFHQCSENSTCVSLQRGATSGICRPNGTALGTQCRDTMPRCDSGLTCFVGTGGGTGTCLRSVTDTCSTYDSVCPMNQDCVNAAGNLGTSGTCVDVGSTAGADCNAMGMCTATGLTCTMRGTANICTRTVRTGEECGLFDECENGGVCYLTDPNNRFRGRCFAPGTRGGPCRTMGTPCDAGLTCSNMNPSMGRCLAMGTMNGPCDFTTDCPDGTACVRTGGGTTFMGTCRPYGTQGAPCRPTGEACDAGLTCSTQFTREGICQAMTTGMCDARSSSHRCPAGQVCLASSLDQGTCATSTMETEPNDVPSMTMAITMVPAAVRGSLVQFDVDCFAVEVPAGGSLFARVATANGLCPGDLALDLYAIEGAELRLLGSDTDSGVFGCPRIDGADPFGNFPWARNTGTTPVRRFVCVRNNAQGRPAVPNYVVSLAVSTR